MKKIIALLLVTCMIFALASCTAKSDGAINAKTEENKVTEEKKETSPIEKEEKKKDEKSEQTLTLYFCDSEAFALHADIRKISGEVTIDAGYAVNELIKGTTAEGLINVIPKDTVLNSCVVEKGLCTVDFSAHLLDAAGSTAELFAIYSIVNTLCGLDGIETVQFTIDGQKVMAFGSYQFDEPFEADMTLVQE